MRTRNKLAAAMLAALMSLGVVACAEGDAGAEDPAGDAGLEDPAGDDAGMEDPVEEDAG